MAPTGSTHRPRVLGAHVHHTVTGDAAPPLPGWLVTLDRCGVGREDVTCSLLLPLIPFLRFEANGKDQLTTTAVSL